MIEAIREWERLTRFNTRYDLRAVLTIICAWAAGCGLATWLIF